MGKDLNSFILLWTKRRGKGIKSIEGMFFDAGLFLMGRLMDNTSWDSYSVIYFFISVVGDKASRDCFFC